LLKLFAFGFFGADVEVAPVDDACGVAGCTDLRAEVANPDVVVKDDFDADAVGGEKGADLKFGATIVEGGLGGFVGSEEEDGSEGSGGADDVHLNFEELLLTGEGGGGIGEEVGAEVLLEFGVGSKGLESEDEDFGGGGLGRIRRSLCGQSRAEQHREYDR